MNNRYVVPAAEQQRVFLWCRATYVVLHIIRRSAPFSDKPASINSPTSYENQQVTLKNTREPIFR